MNSSRTNIWYLDRGKNFFTEEGKDFFETMIAIFNAYKYEISDEFNIIEKFPKKYKNSGNPAALLTTLRNIGIINKENKLADNITNFYLKNRLTYDELIFENLSKVNYDKENSAEIKPLIIIFQMIYALYCINPSLAFITKDECANYLFNIKKYDKDLINNVAQEISRSQRYTSSESVAVLDIWFNALGNLPFFKFKDKNTIQMELSELDFFKFVYDYGANIKHYYYGVDRRFKNFYDECGCISTGINEIIPKVKLIDKINEDEIDYNKMYEFLFGVNYDEKIAQLFYDNAFGIYKPFKSIRNIAIRSIWHDNKNIGEKLFNINLNNKENYNILPKEININVENNNNIYIDSFINIIKEGRINTTYKFVLAIAIIKNITKMINNNNLIETIKFDDISKEFIEHYWDEVVRENFKQSYNENSKAIEIIKDFQEEFKIDYGIDNIEYFKEYGDSIKNYDLYDITLKKFNNLLKADVIQRFDNLDTKDRQIYEYNLDKQYIYFKKENMLKIYKNKDMLLDIIEKRLEDTVYDMNRTLESDIDNEQMVQQKKDAEALLKSYGIDLTYRDWSYAKNQEKKETFWLNPPRRLVDEDWYIVLNNQVESKLIVLMIPKNTLIISNKNDRYLKCRKDRPQYIDLEIYIKDLRIRGTDYYLDKYIQKTIKY